MEIENRETFEITMMTLVNCMNEILPLLQDEEIFEVYINPDGKVWTDSFRGRECTEIIFVRGWAKKSVEGDLRRIYFKFKAV